MKILNMKKYTLILAFLSIVSTAMAQYPRPDNNNGIYTIESEIGDKMTITQNKELNNLTVEYGLTDSFAKAVLIVIDNSGRVIVQLEILYSKDNVIIPVDKWPSGQYTVSIFADKKSILSREVSL